MAKKTTSTLLTRNKIGQLSKEDHSNPKEYLEAIKSIARLTYESIYVINYENMTFEYVSENPLFLCGYPAEEVLKLGYEFYFKNVPDEDLQLLSKVNEAGFDFFERLKKEEKKDYRITYDFHLINKNGKNILINHKLTPLFLTSEGKLWKAICMVSISHHQQAGNVFIHRQGFDQVWELDQSNNTWRKFHNPILTEREVEILRLYAQGLTINQIADKLAVVPDTIKYYRRRIFEHLDVNSIVEALSSAVNRKII